MFPLIAERERERKIYSFIFVYIYIQILRYKHPKCVCVYIYIQNYGVACAGLRIMKQIKQQENTLYCTMWGGRKEGRKKKAVTMRERRPDKKRKK